MCFPLPVLLIWQSCHWLCSDFGQPAHRSCRGGPSSRLWLDWGWVLVFVGAMLQETTAGGAGHVGALFFGWAFVLIWFAPWLLVYAGIQFFRRRHASRNA